jgi:hypothetical protein
MYIHMLDATDQDGGIGKRDSSGRLIQGIEGVRCIRMRPTDQDGGIGERDGPLGLEAKGQDEERHQDPTTADATCPNTILAKKKLRTIWHSAQKLSDRWG